MTTWIEAVIAVMKMRAMSTIAKQVAWGRDTALTVMTIIMYIEAEN